VFQGTPKDTPRDPRGAQRHPNEPNARFTLTGTLFCNLRVPVNLDQHWTGKHIEAFASGSLGTHKKESKNTKRSIDNQKGSSRNATQKVREQSTNNDNRQVSNRQRQKTTSKASEKLAADDDKRPKENAKQKVRKRSNNKEMQPQQIRNIR